MTKRQGVLVLATLFALAGLTSIAVGLQYQYYNRLGPGAGFFPIWIGAVLAALALGIIANALMHPLAEAAGPYFESRDGAFRVMAMLLVMALATWLMGLFGFRLTIFVFALVAPYMIARMQWWLVLVMALLLSFGTAYGFETWLGVRLPDAAIPALRDAGL